jgi:hypothetical protein
MPYAIDGILTKHYINQMILDNNDKLKKKVNASLNLSSVYNNPNCIISNIAPRDYEMLDYIISHTAKTFETYYMTARELKIVEEPQSGDTKKQKKQ